MASYACGLVGFCGSSIVPGHRLSQPAIKRRTPDEALAYPFTATEACNYDDRSRRTFAGGDTVALVDNNNMIEALTTDGSAKQVQRSRAARVNTALLRGFEFTHEAVREWEERFAPLLADQIRRKRKGKVGRRWYVDETYLKVKGKWCYLYRAIDRDGNLVDSMLSPTRDMDAAQRFFLSARSMVNSVPTQVTTDGHGSYPSAIRETLGAKVKHRCSAYMNRRIERNHRAIKQRYYPMLGFGSLPSAQRFWRAFEEVREYFRPRRKQNEAISLLQSRHRFLFRALQLEALFVRA
jgi:putative transposase